MYYTCITLKYKRSHIPVHTMHVLDIWLTQYGVRRHSSKVVDRETRLNSMSTEQTTVLSPRAQKSSTSRTSTEEHDHLQYLCTLQLLSCEVKLSNSCHTLD